MSLRNLNDKRRNNHHPFCIEGTTGKPEAMLLLGVLRTKKLHLLKRSVLKGDLTLESLCPHSKCLFLHCYKELECLFSIHLFLLFGS